MSAQHRYRIIYRDGEVGPYSCVYHARSEEHARERFYENPDDSDGWEIVSVTRLQDETS